MKRLLHHSIKVISVFALALMLYGWAHALLASLHTDAPLIRSQRLWMLGNTLLVTSLLCLLLRRYAVTRWIAIAMIGVAVCRALFPLDGLSIAALAGLALTIFAEIVRPDRNKVQISPPRSSATGSETNAHPQTEPVYEFDDLISVPALRFSDIVGMADTKARLLRAGREIVENGGAQRNGILLSGEPGNGKTMFAQALAGELNVRFFSLSYQDVASKWINETPAKIKAAFARAATLGEAVCFIDEIDAFLKPRGDSSHHMDRDLTNVMLTELVRLRGTRIVVVAACNQIEWLDTAARREGRFDFKITVPPPDLDARKAILNRSVVTIVDRAGLPPAVLDALAERWEGFSAARIASIGPELADMRGEWLFGRNDVTFDLAMQAMRRLQGSKGRLPEHVKRIDDIIMPEASRDELRDLSFRLKHVFELEKLGARLPCGVLFYGIPGTGKTQAAMSLAAASDCAFLKTTGAELLANPSSWDRLIKDAKDLRPTILFIDEADDVLRDRRGSGVAPVTNRILSTIDGADGRVSDILYIAATNHPDALDEASIRGGRFEQQIHFDVPDEHVLASYVRTRIRLLAAGVFGISRHTMEYLVGGLRGSSIADADAALQRVIDSAALRKLREGTTTITMTDVRPALRRPVPHR